MQFGGLILCGGKSSRMGQAKATLPFGPELMLQRVVRLMGEVVGPLVVVAASGQELPPLPEGILIARDEREGRGPLEGLYAGLSLIAGRADAVYATSCDVPLLVPAFVRRMTELLGAHEIAVPVEDALSSDSLASRSPLAPREEAAHISRSERATFFLHPLAAVYRVVVRDRIAALLASDRLRPVFLFDESDTLRVPVEDLRSIDPELTTLLNLNHPDEYAAALVRAGFSSSPTIATPPASR